MKKNLVSIIGSMMIAASVILPAGPAFAQTAPAPDQAALEQQIQDLKSQIIVLLQQLIAQLVAQQSASIPAQAMQPAASTGAAAPDTIQGMTASTAPTDEQKAPIHKKGIGLTQAYIYVEGNEVTVSFTDYFQGESTSIEARAVKDDIVGAMIPGDPQEKCGARIQDSPLLLCSTEATYTIPDGSDVQITASYLGSKKSIIVGSKNLRGTLAWY